MIIINNFKLIRYSYSIIKYYHQTLKPFLMQMFNMFKGKHNSKDERYVKHGSKRFIPVFLHRLYVFF